MARTPAFRQAPREYSQASEHQFRRELENILLVALMVADGIASGNSSTASLTSKRGSYSLPIGAVVLS